MNEFTRLTLGIATCGVSLFFTEGKEENPKKSNIEKDASANKKPDGQDAEKENDN